jgi:FtsZ-interacting cell division protein ZipA
MAELRWILLVAGLVFLVALAAWEKRKPRQANRDAPGRAPARNEPELGTIVEPVASPRSAGGMDEGRRPVVDPLCVDLPAMEAIRDESMMAEVDALPVFEYHPASDGAPGPVAHEPAAYQPAAYEIGAPESESANASEPVAEAAPPSMRPADNAPVVDWPPDGERQIVALRIVAASDEKLSGRAVRLAITGCGFVHGRFGIFHQPDADGRALLSVASLGKPGVLDPVNMDFQRLAGISLFTVLPGPLPPAAALDHLIDVARELSQRLPARVQDEHGQPLDADRLEDLRDSMQRLSRPGMHAEPAA